MKRRIHGVIIAICSMIFISCNSSFEGSDIFKKDFEERSELFSNTEYFSIFEEELTDPQREAMQFLYAYMPSPDITDYSGEFI